MIYPKAIIKLDNLKNNIKYLKSISNESTLMPVVKANAYGHGVIEISKELYNSGIKCVCVATIVEAINQINLYAKKNNQKFRCHIKVDTGMNRMGCKPNEFKDIYNAAINSDSILLEAVYSHLSCNDDATSNHNIFQLQIFEEIISFVKKYRLIHMK